MFFFGGEGRVFFFRLPIETCCVSQSLGTCVELCGFPSPSSALVAYRAPYTFRPLNAGRPLRSVIGLRLAEESRSDQGQWHSACHAARVSPDGIILGSLTAASTSALTVASYRRFTSQPFAAARLLPFSRKALCILITIGLVPPHVGLSLAERDAG